MSQAELPAVRIATPRDEDEVVAMTKRLHAENGMFKYDDDKVRTLLRRCFSGDKVIVGVIGEPGKIEASTCLGIGDFYYTGDWHLEEFWNFVDAEYRRSKNADALIEFGKSCADKMGIPFFTGIITAKQMMPKVRLYRRRLGPPVGAYFLYGGGLSLPQVRDTIDRGYDDLRKDVADFLAKHGDRTMPHRTVRDDMVPLLREVMTMLKKLAEDDVWCSDVPKEAATKHSEGNGATV